jgi:sirohydrochlorin cobaltochelatase
LKEAIVLFGHGSREPHWARPFEQLADTLTRQTDAIVRLAYLELMQPSLADAIATLAREGAVSIRVVPVFLGVGGHTRNDLPKLVEAARQRHAGVRIELDTPIGEQSSVIEAIAAAIVKKR